MLRALLLVILTTSVAGATAESRDRDRTSKQTEAKVDDKKPEPPPPPPRTPGPDDPKAIAILERIVKGPDTAARQKAIDELGAIAPTTIEAIGEWIVRSHVATVDERRAVLALIEAQVPDKDGRFKTPDRKTKKELTADDEIDWLKKLLELDPATPGAGEVIADIAAVRALVATGDSRAAQAIFDAAFHDETMIYRDECGRYLRKLEPYSIPTLTKESAGKVGDRKRYATYQLERLDRQEPNKAFAAAAGDEALTLEIIAVYRKTKIREAVHAMWGKVNDDRTRVRAAAREAWMDYITGPPPPRAPMKKLQLPGGKLTKKEKPLWLNYRELADNELRQNSNELLHTDYQLEDPMSLDDKEAAKVEKIDQVAVTKELFDYYDGERRKLDGAQWAQASSKAAIGDLEAAAALLDRLLAQNPDRAEKADMATIFYARGKQLEEKKAYAEAAVAYSKAHGLDPKGKRATDALAAQHYMQGKALEAAGKDGGPDYRKAVALKPDYAPAQDAAESVSPTKKPTWMLYAAMVAGVFAALLFAAAMMKRRRV